MSRTLELTKELVSRPSITPNDADCQKLLMQRLSKFDFKNESMQFVDVDNLWARFGDSAPLFVFVGHTDVVPPGPIEQWTSPPFDPTIRDGMLYGRGTADMKGSIAAMVVAIENFLQKHSQIKGSIALLITSDEEGQSINGTKKVMECLNARHEKIDWCLVGEPSCHHHLGDTIKIGRRGTLSGKLKIFGKQGHIAYPQNADNAIHRALPILDALTHITWDNGNEFFQPTSFQFSNLNAGTGAGNVIPGELVAQFNFRFSPELTAENLQKRVHAILDQHALKYKLDWAHSGDPFITSNGILRDRCEQVIAALTGSNPTASTVGGTSDGRFVAPSGAQVIEFGPCNGTIHQIDECVGVAELDKLTEIYEAMLTKLLT